MRWYWYAAALIWGVGPMIFLPLWYLAVKYRRQGPGWTEPMTPEAAEVYRRWPFRRRRWTMEEIDNLILRALAAGPMTVPEVATLTNLGPIALYPRLQLLERQGRVVSAWIDRDGKRRRIYAPVVEDDA